MSRPCRRLSRAALGLMSASALVLAMGATAPARAVPVFDSANYAQNLLIAARNLDQITNQIRSLQNEAAMLTSMERHLERIDFPELEGLKQRLEEIEQLMGEAEGIEFRVDGLDERLRSLFPQVIDPAPGNEQRLAEARARLEASRAAFRHAMGVQSQVVETIRSDAEALARIVGRSQGARGALQVGQATNQLLALAAKQQFQLQQLMAAQFRSEAVERALRLQERREARAVTRRFLGRGKAWSPR